MEADWLRLEGFFPPESNQDMEDEVEDPLQGRWPGATPQERLRYRLMWTQSQEAKDGLPKARQRFPALPKWLFRAGELKVPHARWSYEGQAWEYRIQAPGTEDQYRTLTGATLDGYAAAYKDITKMPLALPGGSLC